jgi:ethanolamine ammonia-lyase large subunit
MAKASPKRSADELAGLAAESEVERALAQRCLAEIPLQRFLDEPLIPPESDEVTRLILDRHDTQAFAPLQNLSVGEFREWLLSHPGDPSAQAWGIIPEMAAAVSKIMRNQDLIAVAKRCRVVTRFRNTLGLEGRLSTRLQPNHPTDDMRGIAATILDGLLYGSGDAVIGINPATDHLGNVGRLIHLMSDLIEKYSIPTQSCVLSGRSGLPINRRDRGGQ